MPTTANSNGYHDAYRESEILSAGPVELILILYRAALGAIRSARGCLRQGDIRGRSGHITRAVTILAELEFSVDRSLGHEVGGDLVELYDYVQRLLLEANGRQIDPPLAEAEGLLVTLIEAWSDLAAQPAVRVRACGAVPPAMAAGEA